MRLTDRQISNLVRRIIKEDEDLDIGMEKKATLNATGGSKGLGGPKQKRNKKKITK